MRKSYSKDFKAKVAFEAMREDRTLAELSKVYDVLDTLLQLPKYPKRHIFQG